MSKVIAIIVTFKRKELLEKVVSGIMQQEVKPDKLLIIDNNSDDGTADLINTIENPNDLNILYYNTGANLGGAGGFKYGIQKASEYQPDYIWLMDDDLVPESECLKHLLECADENTICQPLRMNLDGSCAEYSPTIYDLYTPFILRPKRETALECFNNGENGNIALHGIPFEGPLIPGKLVTDIGLPDDKFFIFYDDLDYSIRARKAGYNIKCVVKARARRLLMNSQAHDLSSWKGYFMLRNFFRIHFLHGENIIVKNRPFFITLIFVLRELLKGNKKGAIVCLDAYRDHKALDFEKNKKYMP